jgi:hypothetical protein
LEDAIVKKKDWEDAIARMLKLDPKIIDGHIDFLQVTLITDVNCEAEIMRRLKTVELRDKIEKSEKPLAECEEKERKERERFELVEAKKHEKEEKAKKLAQLNKKVLSKKRPFTQEDLDSVATHVAIKEEEE